MLWMGMSELSLLLLWTILYYKNCYAKTVKSYVLDYNEYL